MHEIKSVPLLTARHGGRKNLDRVLNNIYKYLFSQIRKIFKTQKHNNVKNSGNQQHAARTYF